MDIYGPQLACLSIDAAKESKYTTVDQWEKTIGKLFQ